MEDSIPFGGERDVDRMSAKSDVQTDDGDGLRRVRSHPLWSHIGISQQSPRRLRQRRSFPYRWRQPLFQRRQIVQKTLMRVNDLHLEGQSSQHQVFESTNSFPQVPVILVYLDWRLGSIQHSITNVRNVANLERVFFHFPCQIQASSPNGIWTSDTSAGILFRNLWQ